MNNSGSESFGIRKPREQLVGHLPTDDLDELWKRATSRIVKYGFSIEYRHLELPRTGTFDGLQILIDPDVSSERLSEKWFFHL